MVIYDYGKDSTLFSVVYSLVAIVCIVCLIILLILGIRTFIKKGLSHPIFLLSLAIIVALSLSVYFAYYAFSIAKFTSTCASGDYESVRGPLEIKSVVACGYRDEELYAVDFVVDGILFSDLLNSFSAEQKELLTTLEKVEVRYSYLNDQMVIYQIVFLTDE